jgi:xanthine/uracil permease
VQQHCGHGGVHATRQAEDHFIVAYLLTLILQFAPDWVKNLLSSGIAAGGITAIVLNLIFPPEKN